MRAPRVGPEAWEQKTVSQDQLCHQPSGGPLLPPSKQEGAWASLLGSGEGPGCLT